MITVNSTSPLRVLFVALRHDYGVPERGDSFEYLNFFDTLSRMPGVDAHLFGFDEIMRAHGREKMNEMLLKTVGDLQPSVTFFFLFTDEIRKDSIRKLSSSGKTITVNWFADDHWRFRGFTRHYAPCFNWSVTTDRNSVPKYRRLGYENVILSQWGVNHYQYLPSGLPIKYDVSFVGQVHSDREDLVSRLEKSGVRVDCWGRGWPNGRLSSDEMIRVFSQSRINLNFTASSAVLNRKAMAKIIVNRRADSSLHLRSPLGMWENALTLLKPAGTQIKGRNFEIPGCGGFLLTGAADGLEVYYLPGKEIAVFHNDDELIDSVRYYLAHEDERAAICRAGFDRTLREHTYEQRFRKLFHSIGALKQ
jgi:spore maturation protein CgeB